MKRFKNIMVIFNQRTDNDVAFKQATWIAKINNAELTIVEVIEDVPYYLREIVVKERLQLLEKAYMASSKEEMKVAYKVLLGPPFVEVIKEVQRNHFDLVIMEPQKPIGALTRIFCSLTIHLIRKCPCAVWIMRPKSVRERGFKILAAIDAAAENEQVDMMNCKIMEVSTSLTAMANCELHVIHAWSHPWEAMLRTRPDLTKDQRHDAIKDVRIERKNYLKNLLGSCSIQSLKHELHVIKGEPIDVIPGFILTREVDMIVIGTLCKTGIAGIIVGNTCEDILQQVNCSVLALKPDGFKTPVKL